MKRCSKCETEKPLADFYRRSASGDGRQSCCKACQKPAHAERLRLHGEGLKRCTRCGEAKPLDSFGSHPTGYFRLRPDCRECKNEDERRRYRESPPAHGERERAQRRRWAAANPERQREIGRRSHRNNYLRRTYGLTNADFAALLELQGGRCGAGCGRIEPGGPGTWKVDHDHACCPGVKSCGGCVRGLVCFYCNTGLGNLGDSIEGLRRALNYLEDPPFKRLQVGVSHE